MKLFNKFSKALLVGSAMMCMFATTAHADWYQSSDSIWHYNYPDGTPALTGTHMINGVNYMFDAAGNMLTGWQQTANGWMYFDAVSGAQAVGGWKTVDGKWYYFDTNGIMLVNTTTPDGYTVDANGVWIESAAPVSTNQNVTTNNQKTLQELYQENFNNGTFIDYSNGANTGIITTNGVNTSNYNSNSSNAEVKSLDELSDSELYKMITGSYNSATDPTKNYSNDEAIEAVIRLVNVLRSKKGLNEVVANDTLMEAAQVRAEEGTEKFSHTRPDGSDCFTALDEAGWPQDTHAAENLAQGQKTALQVMNAWYHSSGHKHNMLHEKNGTIGVGIAGSGYSTTWSQFFSE